MIGWAPFLLTGVAGALVVIVALDASSGFHASAYSRATRWEWLHNALNASVQWLSHLGVQDSPDRCRGLPARVGLGARRRVRPLGTIQIADLSCDDDKLAPTAAKAVLQQASVTTGCCRQRGPQRLPERRQHRRRHLQGPDPQALAGVADRADPMAARVDGLSDQRQPAAHRARRRCARVLCLRTGLHRPAAERPPRGGRGRRPHRGDHRGQPRHLPDHRGGRAPHLPDVGPMRSRDAQVTYRRAIVIERKKHTRKPTSDTWRPARPIRTT